MRSAIFSSILSSVILLNLVAGKPNLVFILADDLGYGDVGCFGAPDINTPNLDRLAEEGIRFTSNYSNSAICSPTRAAFMTGRYFQRIGLEWAVWYQAPGEGLPPTETSLATMLKAAGYSTALAGKWHLGYEDGWRPNQHGFDHFFGCLGGNVNYFEYYDKTGTHDLFLNDETLQIEGYMTDLTAEYAVQFIETMKEQPFFLFASFNAPHFPFQGPEDKETEFSWSEGTRERNYIPMVESLDTAVGRIVDAIDSAGLAENTLVVFTSDNGGEKLARNYPLRGSKGSLWEGGIRVPAIARWTHHITKGRVSDHPIQTIDWSATLLGLASAVPPKNRPLDGVDLTPLLTENNQIKGSPLFFRRALDPHRSRVNSQRAVRVGQWKYIDEPDGGRQLFDLENDMAETQDLIDQHASRALEMQDLLDQWESEIDPPLYDQRAQALKNKAARDASN
ncbi:MAG: sulfatase-like hydrolase/transferase [Verrucomicrobia bacterium]|nr:sulfatase-like hydrolase/transferase [Verrucomicrobiota bacterium]